jgi:hypothetical protein
MPPGEVTGVPLTAVMTDPPVVLAATAGKALRRRQLRRRPLRSNDSESLQVFVEAGKGRSSLHWLARRVAGRDGPSSPLKTVR